MCLLNSVELRLVSALKEALWFLYLVLKSVAVSPTYVSLLLLHVTVALRYLRSLVRHSPCKGHVVFLGQLHFFSFLV